MAEKSENEASKTGQPVESPETEAHESKDAERGADAVSAAGQHEEPKRDRQGEPYGDSGTEADRDPNVDAAGNAYPTNPEQPKPYSESEDHIPDPTAMSGTLETSGTGGGLHESVKGTTEVFSGMPTTLEVHGLALHRSEIISGDNTGQPEPHRGEDARVATTEDQAREGQIQNQTPGDADGVSAGEAGVAKPVATSYSETVIAGGADPNQRTGEPEGGATTARKTGETPETEAKEGEQAEGSTAAKTTAAKKTTARKTTASKSTTDK